MMKRYLFLLILSTMLALMVFCCAPALADIPVISSGGVELHITEYKLRDSDDPNLTLYVYLSNDNDYEIHISGDNAYVDGTPVRVLGFAAEPYCEYGDNSQSIMLKATKEDPAGGAAALRSARHIEMDVTVLDDNYKTILVEHVSMSMNASGSLTSGSSGSDSGDDNIDADFGHGGSHSYAPPYTPASYDFKTLRQGSKGQAVRDLQQRLTDLGYLNDRVDGSYGRNTNTAVRSFCSQHGLPIGSEATPEMQSLLYSSNAQYYEEPYLPLQIAASFTLETPLQTGLDNIGMITQLLINRSSTRGIRGYVLSYYQTDMYGNRIDLDLNGRGIYHFESEEMNYIEPAHYEDAFAHAIPKFYSTYAVYIGVQKVVMDDGEVREISLDDVQYFECRVQN